MKSKRHATKVMALGVIARPVPSRQFDGKVSFLRVARDKVAQQKSTKAPPSNVLNGWKDEATDEMTVSEIILAVKTRWPEMVDERLQLRYYQQDSDLTTNERKGYLQDDESVSSKSEELCKKHRNAEEMDLDDVHLVVVSHLSGETYEDDVNCDGDFMEEALLNTVGPELRAAFHWVPDNVLIRLQMDNAGGHGGLTRINKMKEEMLARFNVLLVCQPPNSPESNVLDLGVWRSVQSKVDKMDREQRMDAHQLWATIQRAWDEYGTADDNLALHAIWEKLRDIAEVTIASNGDNNNAEAKYAGARKRARAKVARYASIADAAEAHRQRQEEEEDEEEEDGGQRRHAGRVGRASGRGGVGQGAGAGMGASGSGSGSGAGAGPAVLRRGSRSRSGSTAQPMLALHELDAADFERDAEGDEMAVTTVNADEERHVGCHKCRSFRDPVLYVCLRCSRLHHAACMGISGCGCG